MELSLDPSLQQVSDSLKQVILQEIHQSGAMPFSRYMEHALYHPEWGYYRNGSIKFGAEGDFVTAPELSPLFARCLARQCVQVFVDLDRPVIVEFGAGSGRLACDLLTALSAEGSLPDQYWIVELSAELRARQRDAIERAVPKLLPRVQWLERLPAQVNGVIIANEVLDAMPVEKFVIDGEPRRLCVQERDGALSWSEQVIHDARLLADIERLAIPSGTRYESELNRFLPGWVKSLSACLQKGVILLIDYGFPRHEYYHPDRVTGTLMCHYRQRAFSEPLLYPGAYDITAHVDFTAVAEAASAADLDVLGFSPQAAFLLSCGLQSMLDTQLAADRAYELAQQVKYLTLPSEMGELFKVMALGRGVEQELLGFELNDQLHRL